MFRRRTVFNKARIRPWFATTLYDLPENRTRLQELLPIRLRKGFDTPVPNLQLKYLSQSNARPRRPLYGNQPAVWDSRSPDPCASVGEMRKFLKRSVSPETSRPELTLRRPFFNFPPK